MERNISLSPLWLKCLSFAHFTKICNHVNPLQGQLSEPGPCNCKNLKLELCQFHGEFASENERGIQGNMKAQETGGWERGLIVLFIYTPI